jgi:hypothetical protein
MSKEVSTKKLLSGLMILLAAFVLLALPALVAILAGAVVTFLTQILKTKVKFLAEGAGAFLFATVVCFATVAVYFLVIHPMVPWVWLKCLVYAAAGLAIVDVLDTGREPQPGHLQTDPELEIAALRHLPVDEQPEALLEAKLPEVHHPHLLFPGPGHAPEPQSIKLVEGRMG